jgi:hypothetical protein
MPVMQEDREWRPDRFAARGDRLLEQMMLNVLRGTQSRIQLWAPKDRHVSQVPLNAAFAASSVSAMLLVRKPERGHHSNDRAIARLRTC